MLLCGDDDEHGYAFHQLGFMLCLANLPNPLFVDRLVEMDAIYKASENTLSSPNYKPSSPVTRFWPIYSRYSRIRYYSYQAATKIFSMTVTSRLLLGATSLLYVAQVATAVPYASNSLARALIKRDQVTFEDCGGDDDDKRKKAGQAWSEAANLASFTIDGTLDDGTGFKDTTA